MKVDTRTREELTEALRNMKDKDIDYSDIPDFPDEAWAKAKVVSSLNKKGDEITIIVKSEDRVVKKYVRKVG